MEVHRDRDRENDKIVEDGIKKTRIQDQNIAIAKNRCTDCNKIEKLTACHRSKWTTAPDVPQFKEGDKLKCYINSLGELDKQRRLEPPKDVCHSRDQYCRRCVRKHGCNLCESWECDSCQKDIDTPRKYKEYHKIDPDVYEDEYGRRGTAEESALKVGPTLF
eukprot:Awhi_evm1s7395